MRNLVLAFAFLIAACAGVPRPDPAAQLVAGLA